MQVDFIEVDYIVESITIKPRSGSNIGVILVDAREIQKAIPHVAIEFTFNGYKTYVNPFSTDDDFQNYLRDYWYWKEGYE